MSNSKKKFTITVNYSIIQLTLIVLSILLSTGIWKPESNFFLWSWLTFSPHHIIGPLCVIIFIPILWGILCAILFLAAVLIIGIVRYWVRSR